MQQVYLSITHPLIRDRMRSVIIILIFAFGVEFLLSSVAGILFYLKSNDLTNFVIMEALFALSSAAVMLALTKAHEILKNKRIYQATNWFVVTICISLSALVFIGGGMAGVAFFAYPVAITLTGLVANRFVMFLVSGYFFFSIIFLYGLGHWGYEPLASPLPLYFNTMQMLNLVLLIWGSYAITSLMTQDFAQVISQLEVEMEKVNFLANYDSLTCLPNRYYCESQFETYFNDLAPDESPFLLFVDIDDFKSVNSRLGHRGGDEVLRQVGMNLKAACKPYHAMACRIGGDEFLLLLRSEAQVITDLLATLHQQACQRLNVDRESLTVTCSIGITSNFVIPNGYQTAYQQADIAMHQAKKSGKNTHVYYHPRFYYEAIHESWLLGRLQQALSKDEFFIEFQPIVNLSTHQVCGAEALIRWRLDEETVLLPGRFISWAEKYGLIEEISAWVLLKACQACKYWQQHGFPHLYISVNISAYDLMSGALPKYVREALHDADLQACYLELELTESALFNLQGSVQSQLKQLRCMGVVLSIDDFGTGYSNLAYLGKMDVQKLKIDRAFVSEITQSNQSFSLVSSIVAIAENFRLTVVVEGIEQAVELSKLTELNCHYGQGFYWSKPLSQENYLLFLEHVNVHV